MGVFTAVDGGVRNCGFVAIGRAMTSGLYTNTNCINLCLGEEIFGLIEMRAVASSCQVSMMEVSICRYLDIGATNLLISNLSFLI